MEVTRGTISEPGATALMTRADTEQSILPAPTFLPVSDVRAYLNQRQPVPHFASEQSLFVRLPDKIKSELTRLLGMRPGGGAFGLIYSLTHGKGAVSVSRAVVEACRQFKLPGSIPRNRARYDLWAEAKDWVCLVNRAKAGAAWQQREDGLPLEFLRFAAKRLSDFERDDGKRQAVMSINRQWRTGRNENGDREPIPGFGFWQEWFRAEFPGVRLPAEAPKLPGGSYSNITTQINAANLFPKIVRAIVHEGDAAAREFAPHVRFDRNSAGADGGPLRFLEMIEFDDVRCDFLVLDEKSGQACDLWLLIARDRGTGMLLGFGLRPARSREDGTQEHLKLRDMKQLGGWLLERYGLPPYRSLWRLERGTATLPPAIQKAMREMFDGMVDISYTGMTGGKSVTGYEQRGIGNSTAKGSLESQNRLQHTMTSCLPAQIGRDYGRRPADIKARADEAEDIWESVQHLPEHLRNQAGYPVLTINDARAHLLRVFGLQNTRTEHDLQGFADVVEWYEPTEGRWLSQAVFAGQPNVKFRKRKESPMERCARLVAPYRQSWSNVSPEIVRALYVHTIRDVWVQDNGLVRFRCEGREFEFKPGPGWEPQVPGAKLLAYFHPDEPRFLYLTSGKGELVGVWVRKDYAHDRQTLDDAIHYKQSAIKAAKQMASDYTADKRAALESMRENNTALLAASTFVAVTETPAPTKEKQSPIANALNAMRKERKKVSERDRQESQAAADALLASASAPADDAAESTAGDDLLRALTKSAPES